MREKERVEIRILDRIKNDAVYRAFISSALSFFVTIAFTLYNIFLGAVFHSVWNISIAVYYVLLLVVRACVIFSEKIFHKNKLTEQQLKIKRKKLFFAESLYMFAIDFILIVPISLMVLQAKAVNYSTITAISIAAYTTYKITLASRNIVKTRKDRNLSLKILRTVNLVDALVSVLSLQYTLIMTFDGGMDGDMFLLCAVSSLGIWILLISISFISLMRSIKLHK